MYRPLYWFGGVPGKEFEHDDQLSLAEPPVYSDGNRQVSITLEDYRARAARSRHFYRRHGYAERGQPIRLPDGPPMWPMWREPTGQPGNER